MLGNPRWMWLRLGVWAVIIVAVIFMMEKPEIGDEVGRAALEAMGMAPTPEWTELQRPEGTLSADQAGDPMAVIQAVENLDHGCLPSGTTIRVLVDENGLRSAAVKGVAPVCAAAAVWKAPWPALAAPFELELTRP